MTLKEIETSDKSILTASDVAELLNVNPHSLRMQAQSDPDKLGFPVVVIGTRVKIPRIAFLNFMEGNKNHE